MTVKYHTVQVVLSQLETSGSFCVDREETEHTLDSLWCFLSASPPCIIIIIFLLHKIHFYLSLNRSKDRSYTPDVSKRSMEEGWFDSLKYEANFLKMFVFFLTDVGVFD